MVRVVRWLVFDLELFKLYGGELLLMLYLLIVVCLKRTINMFLFLFGCGGGWNL